MTTFYILDLTQNLNAPADIEVALVSGGALATKMLPPEGIAYSVLTVTENDQSDWNMHYVKAPGPNALSTVGVVCRHNYPVAEDLLSDFLLIKGHPTEREWLETNIFNTTYAALNVDLEQQFKESELLRDVYLATVRLSLRPEALDESREQAFQQMVDTITTTPEAYCNQISIELTLDSMRVFNFSAAQQTVVKGLLPVL